jgi:hypothetical protein
MSEIGPTTCKEWEAVLDVSIKHRPVLSDARTLAILKISNIIRNSGMEGVRLGRQYKVASFFRDGFQKLVQQPTYLTEEEEDRLGFKTTCKLYRLREDYYRSHGFASGKSKAYRARGGELVISAIEKAFSDELEGMDM